MCGICLVLLCIWNEMGKNFHPECTQSHITAQITKFMGPTWGPPGPWFNIKMSSYQYRKSHCGDKTVVRSSYLHNGISYTGKMASLYWFCPLGPVSPRWAPCWPHEPCYQGAHNHELIGPWSTFHYWFFLLHFKFLGNVAVLKFSIWSSDHNQYLYMLRQHSCYAMCIISFWSLC